MRKHFVHYRPLTREEQNNEGVLGINGITAPIGIRNILIRVEDDQGNIHNYLLLDVHHLSQSLLNIIVPQNFLQQRQSEGDTSAHCDIRNNGFCLEWTGEDGQKASKFVPLTATNVGISRTTTSYSRFPTFATLFRNYTMPAYVSDEEDAEKDTSQDPPSNLPPPEPPPDEPTTAPRTMPLTMNLTMPKPNRIETDEDQLLLEPDARQMPDAKMPRLFIWQSAQKTMEDKTK